MKHLHDIAVKRAPDLGLSTAAIESYLRNFRYRLGPEDRDGLETFKRMFDRDPDARS
jgi:predicted solute-binding protein